MQNLLETIRIDDGKINNVSYHQERFDTSRLQCFGTSNILDLKTLINPPQKGLYRCRIVYHIDIVKIEYIPYIPKEITKIKVVYSDIKYPYKYEERSEINALLPANIDEIIIVKNGLITDTSIANIALFDGKDWLTPKSPLLKGTYRQKLLDNHSIKTRDIKISQLKDYQKIAIINAMLGFKILDKINIKEIR